MRIINKSNRFYWILGIVLFFLTFLIGIPYVTSDGYCYYHIARSVRDYGTFTTPIKPEYYDYRGHVIAFYDNKYADVCASGTAIAELPGLMIAKLFRTPEQTIYTDYSMAYNGHTYADGISVLLTAVVFAYLCLVMLYQFFKHFKLSGKWPAFLTIAIGISSYLQWYMYIQPGYTHIYEFFAVTALLLFGAKYRSNHTNRYIVYSGLIAGFGFLVRPTFALVALASLIWLVYTSKQKFKTIIYFLLSALPFGLIYMIYNYQSYGSVIASGYNTIRSENFIFDWEHFNFLNVLFSPQRGWFVYSPLFLIGVIGLFTQLIKGSKSNKLFSALWLGVIFSTALAYGFWPAWWGGGGNGARFLIVLAPLTAPGLIVLLKQAARWQPRVQKLLTILIIISTSYSAILGFCYLFTPVAGLRPITDFVGTMSSGDRYTPIDLIKYQIGLIKNAKSPLNYADTLFRNFTGGNSNLILSTGIQDVVLRFDERIPGQVGFLFVPPTNKSQPLADKIEFLLEDTETKNLFAGILTKPETGKTYSIKIENNQYTSISPEISITPTTADKYYLDFDVFVGLRLENYPVKLYFMRASNIKFSGPPLYQPLDQRTIFILGEP